MMGTAVTLFITLVLNLLAFMFAGSAVGQPRGKDGKPTETACTLGYLGLGLLAISWLAFGYLAIR